MAEGHIESYLSLSLSLSVCVCVCVCVFQNRFRPITSTCMVGFGNNLAQIIITRHCVANKNHVARSKVKVTVRT